MACREYRPLGAWIETEHCILGPSFSASFPSIIKKKVTQGYMLELHRLHFDNPLLQTDFLVPDTNAWQFRWILFAISMINEVCSEISFLFAHFQVLYSGPCATRNVMAIQFAAESTHCHWIMLHYLSFHLKKILRSWFSFILRLIYNSSGSSKGP